mgnify:CR=1 FL=1
MAINSFKGINSILDVVDTIQSVESTVVYPRGVLVIDSSRNIKLGDGTTAGGLAVAGSSGFGNSSVDSHLNTSTATSGQVLSWTGTDYDWVAQSGGGGGLSNLVEDTSPELGGDLDTNGKDILLLNNRVKYNSSGGSMLDFTVTQYSVANNTVLSSVGSINLFLDSASADTSGDTAFRIFDTTDPDATVTEANNIFKVADTGDVSIKGKLQFPDGGASSNYAAFGANDDLKIFHNGNHSIVRETGTGNLYLQSNDNVILSKDSDTEIMVKGIADGAVELYHDNVKKFETTATGVQAVDDVLIQGATPYLTIRRTNNANIPLIRFQGSAGANGATIGMDGTGGSVNDLIISAYGNAERLRIETNGGVKVTGDLTITGRTDIKGSVFGDDSTVIVDSVNSAVTAKLISVNGPEPTSGSDAGEVGEIRFSDNYIYIKTAGAGWKRANLSGIA